MQSNTRQDQDQDQCQEKTRQDTTNINKTRQTQTRQCKENTTQYKPWQDKTIKKTKQYQKQGNTISNQHITTQHKKQHKTSQEQYKSRPNHDNTRH